VKAKELYEDFREGPKTTDICIPLKYKDLIMNEIKCCLEKIIPGTSRYLREILSGEGFNVAKSTLCAILKKWGVKYGELKVKENRQDRQYVLDNLKKYVEILKNNENKLLMSNYASFADINDDLISSDEEDDLFNIDTTVLECDSEY